VAFAVHRLGTGHCRDTGKGERLMARNQYSLNHSALDNILKSDKVMDIMTDLAWDIVDATGMPDTEYEVEGWEGRSRNRVSIKTVGVEAHVREARDHNLVRALGGVQSAAPVDPNRLIQYTSRSGRVSMRTQAEIDNYTRNSSG
jgi:hypothetical protein